MEAGMILVFELQNDLDGLQPGLKREIVSRNSDYIRGEFFGCFD
jgi:hypothetical protein